MQEYEASDRQPPPAPADEITVLELCACFWRHVKKFYVRDGQPTSEQEGIRNAIRLVKELYGHVAAVDFGPLALKAVRKAMIEKKWARNTINTRMDKIKRMFRWCASEQLIPVTVYQALATVEGLKQGRSAARETDAVQPVADAVIQQTLPKLPPTVCDMVRLQRLTGMRPNEVCIIRPCDLDRSKEVWEYRPQFHKTMHRGRDRVIPIGPKGQAILLPYLLRESEAYCFDPREAEKRRLRGDKERKYDWVRKWRRVLNPHYVVSSYWSAIKRACVEAGVKPWSPNRLRHTAATEIRAKYGLEASQTVLGHARADVTQIYAERDGTLAASVMKEIG